MGFAELQNELKNVCGENLKNNAFDSASF